MNAQIRYIAIKSRQPEELAQYYRHYFSMDELGRTDGGDVALTDGFYNLSILKSDESDLALGFSHFGVAVDDLHELLRRFERFAHPNFRISTEPGDLTHGQYRIAELNGLPISLSTDGFGVPPLQGERKLPAIRHIALCVSANDDHRRATSNFFVDVFGFRIQEGGIGGVADGATALQVLPYPVSANELPPEAVIGPRHRRYGLNHFGWLVEDLELTLKSLPEGTIHKRPSNRPMTEWRTFDVEGNEQDLSHTKGYQIDAGVWVRGDSPSS